MSCNNEMLTYLAHGVTLQRKAPMMRGFHTRCGGPIQSMKNKRTPALTVYLCMRIRNDDRLPTLWEVCK
jgi:hypothetical protein